MIDLVKQIHEQEANEEDILITDRHIVADRTMHLYRKATFKNCDIEIAPHNAPRFILEKDAVVVFEKCRFVGTLAKPVEGSSTHPAFISAPEDSAITFISCHMENPDSFISSAGAVNLHGCEISYRGSAVSGDDAYKSEGNNSLLMQYAEISKAFGVKMQDAGFTEKNPVGALACWFISADGGEVEMTDCILDCEKNSDYSVALAMEQGALRNCNISGAHKIGAGVLYNCTFDECITISLQVERGNGEATDCRFVNCHMIDTYESALTGCEITGLKDCLSLGLSTAEECSIRNIKPETDGMISLGGSELTNCLFENITLKDDFLLISADNDSSLTGCTFKTCRTTREDLQLISAGGYKGKVIKKWVEDDICYDCTGLDKIIHIESWEEDA